MALMRFAALAALLVSVPVTSMAQSGGARMQQVPERRTDEGSGPYRKLVIRGAMMIRGDGAPPMGPVDIVVEGNRIAAVTGAGTPGLPLKAGRDPSDADREIDATGMYVLPGFVDTHGHNGDPAKAPQPSYGYKLWLAHGVTAVRGVSFYFGPNNPSLDDKSRSAANTIVAPRLFAYLALGDAWSGGDIDSPVKARA